MTEQEFKTEFENEFNGKFHPPVEFLSVTEHGRISYHVGINTVMGGRITAVESDLLKLLVVVRAKFAKEVYHGR